MTHLAARIPKPEFPDGQESERIDPGDTGDVRLLPAALLPNKEAFEKLGFKFGKPAGELFISCVLPDGWYINGEQKYYSDIFDDQGQVRATSLYRSAHNENRAVCWLVPRYYLRTDYDHNTEMVTVKAWDRTDPIHTIGKARVCQFRDYDALQRAGETWLEENFPSYRDPNAYW